MSQSSNAEPRGFPLHDQALNEARLAGIIDSAMDAIITVDDDQRVVVFNAAAERTFGMPAAEALGQPLDRFIPERFRHAHRDHVQTYGVTNVTRRSATHLGSLIGLRGNGEEFPIEASISQVEVGGRRFFTAILRDITEKRHAEAHLLRAQRLESVGTLAGGLAHDLNNILAPIMMSVRLLERKLANDPEGLECVAMLDQLAQRGANIIRQVLSFARGVEGDRMPTQMKHIVTEVCEMLRETLPRSIRIDRGVSSDLWLAVVDPTQIHQVLMNLAVNARDAMPNGGTLTVTARNVVVDPHFAHIHPDARPGNYVSIAVGDTGSGIASEHLMRIFDPFFTTKPLGEGTGLGLATALGIVQSHDGFITVYSEPGQGSRFNVHLPAAVPETPERTSAPADEAAALPRGNGELVMIVDDEKSVRDMTGRMLTEFGYRVVIAEDGQAAIRMLERHSGEVTAVVLDLMMPVLDGIQTAQALRRMNPHVRLIGTSGLPSRRRFEDVGVSDFLLKPYTADDLLRILRNPAPPPADRTTA